MTVPVTLHTLFEQLGGELALSWDGQGEERPILQAGEGPIQPPVGPFNMIRPNRIQVVGPPELAHLRSLAAQEYNNCLRHLFATQPAAIIFTNDLKPLPQCAEQALASSTPLLLTPQADYRVIRVLQAYFNRPDTITTLLNGVFLEVFGKGVLLTGEPAVGKSEVALDLITRGHRLVADDAVEITRQEDSFLKGRCPAVLQDFLEVRGLGLINVRAMFGNSAIKPSKFLHLIIDLQRLRDDELADIDRLYGSHSKRTILGTEVDQTRLPVAPGRNLAILVETAVRQHLLITDGYNAADDFSQRQQAAIDRPTD